MSYELIVHEEPAYLHAQARGERTPESTRRFLVEAYTACIKSGRDALLLEISFTGPSLGLASIHSIVSERSAEAARLRKIAYVDATSPIPERKEFAETVALNRGINVRLFRDLDAARQWLLEPTT